MIFLNNFEGPLCYVEEEADEDIVLLFEDETDVREFYEVAYRHGAPVDFFDEAYMVDEICLPEGWAVVYWKQVPVDVLFGKENN